MTLHFRIALLLLGSGSSALIYQTAWQRSFRLIFGATTGASAAVLAVFMAGLGVGGYLLGKRAERSSRPLKLYADLELLVTLVAAVSPFTTDLLGRVYLGLGGEPELGFAGATLARLLIALLVMGPAAFFMGGTLPAAARAAETDDDGVRRHLAVLYALNTCGAVLGCVLGTFLLFEFLGTRLALWFGCAINLLVAIVARGWARALPEVPVQSASENQSPKAEKTQHPRLERYAVYTAAALVGFTFLGSELVWFRMLGPLLGGSTYSFGLILAVALVGIGLGGFLYSARHAETKVTWLLLALTVLFEAFWLSLPLWLGDGLALFTAQLRNLAALGFPALVLSWTLTAMIVVLPAALVAGYQFPVLIALLGRGRSDVATHVGQAYLWNTAGSVVGSLLVGFYALPRFGAVATWRGLTILLLIVAAVAFFWAWRRRELEPRSKLVLAACALAATFAFLNAVGPTAVWRHTPVGAGRVSLRNSDVNFLKDWTARRRNIVLWEKDGVDVGVAVTVDTSANFVVSGKSDGSVHDDRGTQAMSSLMGALLHPNPKQAFVLGLGTGMSAGWLARVVEHVDVAELEPAIVEVARTVGPANGGVLEAGNVDLFLGDGREFLLTTDKKYDLLVSEPSNPYRAGVAALFTTDFYEVVRSRMAEQAVFVQWLQGYEVNASVVLLTLRSLKQVFPFVEIWQSQETDIIFVASVEPRTYDLTRLRERVLEPGYRDLMRRAWLGEGVESLFAHAIANAAFVDRLLEKNSPPVNTDDENTLEFSVARTVGQLQSTAASDLFLLALREQADIVSTTGAPLDMPWVRSLRYRNFILSGGGFPNDMRALSNRRGVTFESGCTGNARPNLPPGVLLPEPRDILEIYAFGRILALEGDSLASAFADRLAQEGFDTEAEFLRGLVKNHSRDFEGAALAYELSMEGLRRVPIPLCEVSQHVVAAAEALVRAKPELADRLARALLRGPFIGYNSESARISAAQTLAFKSPDPGLCVEALGKDLLNPKWTASFLKARLTCLERASHPHAEQARKDVTAFEGATSGSYGIFPTPLSGAPAQASDVPNPPSPNDPPDTTSH